MSPRRSASARLLLLLLFLLPGCWAVDGPPAYSLAQGCYSLRAVETGGSMTAEPGGDYALVAGEGSAPDRFFLEPTGLGTYLLHDQQGGFLAATGEAPSWQAGPDDRTEWAIHELEVLTQLGPVAAQGRLGRSPQYSLTSTRGLRLVATGDGPRLARRFGDGVGVGAAWLLEEQSPESCEAPPEASLDAVVAPAFHEPRDPGEPAVGFADLHTHIGFPKALGALAMSGGIVHRFGIEHALGDCTLLHGPNGSFDLLGSQTGSTGHDTTGYPAFTEWPNRTSTTHVQAYHRWIERAYLSGLRLVVTLATGNRTLCQALGLFLPGDLEGDCTPASTVELQTGYVYEIQDYIDAQAGGPGKGWFRVVTSPAQAREVIAANKLAVVLGVEYGELIDCRRGEEACTPAYVDQELEKLYELGVRSVFPIHRFDNAFGGTRIQDGDTGAWLNLANKISSSGVVELEELLTFRFQGGGQFWEVEECPPGLDGVGGVRDMDDFVHGLPSLNPIFELFESAGVIEKLEPIPDYAELAGTTHLCNPRPLQPIGEYLVRRLMDMGLVVEVDHLSHETLTAMLDLLEERGYSGLVSSHGWIEDQPEIRERIFALGGLMSPFNSNPSRIASIIATYAEEMSAYPYPVGVGIGTDIQGVAAQATSDEGRTTTYPFASWDGTVQFQPPRTGDRSFDFDTEGLAHYGLLPEWVEQLRQADEEMPADVMGTFMRSAEAYLSMWERAEANASAAEANAAAQ
jgi:hypothetical protein